MNGDIKFLVTVIDIYHFHFKTLLKIKNTILLLIITFKKFPIDSPYRWRAHLSNWTDIFMIPVFNLFHLVTIILSPSLIAIHLNLMGKDSLPFKKQ